MIKFSNLKIQSLLAAGMLFSSLAGASAVNIGDSGSITYHGRQSSHYQTSGGSSNGVGGGEFSWTGLSNESYAGKTSGIRGGASSFQSFCLERNEYVGSGNYVVNHSAVKGGFGSDPGGSESADPISLGTAYLYSEFAKGTLTGYDYTTSGRKDSAGLLQAAIWGLEDELPTDPAPGSNLFYDAAFAYVSANYGVDADVSASPGQYGVYALNITAGGVKQDALYYSVPDGGATLCLLGLSLAGVAFVNRSQRFSKKA